jgi:hypothetical protein
MQCRHPAVALAFLFRCCALVGLMVGFAVVTNAQVDKKFPTDDEINLLLTQTDRAVQQYNVVIDQEEIQMGKSYAKAVARDRQVVNGLETAVKAFKAHPQAFNGPLGFAFFEWLDDADRNALLLGSGALAQATTNMRAGDTDAEIKANNLIHLFQMCTDASSLLYTVSENVGSLYQRYVEAENQTAVKGLETVQKCMEALKKTASPPKK